MASEDGSDIAVPLELCELIAAYAPQLGEAIPLSAQFYAALKLQRVWRANATARRTRKQLPTAVYSGCGYTPW